MEQITFQTPISRNVLDGPKKFAVASWLEREMVNMRHINATRDRAASIATLALGFAVSAGNIEAAERTIGHRIKPMPVHRARCDEDSYAAAMTAIMTTVEALNQRVDELGDELRALRASLGG